MSIKSFIDHNFCHFNSGVVRDAAKAYELLLERDGKMLVTLAGAMSTAQIGKTLAEMIRQDKVHAICCTGANLEEDLFNLVGRDDYIDLPWWRVECDAGDKDSLDAGYNRVTDVLIPEDVINMVGRKIEDIWSSQHSFRPKFPHEFVISCMFDLVTDGKSSIPVKDSWLWAAMEKNIPLFVPGWEDSSLGNLFAARCLTGQQQHQCVMKTGIDYMIELVKWYGKQDKVGFFQIGGGIAGDFAICAVPLMRTELNSPKTPHWSYFCQISDATTSYGGYSGAPPNEKISWDKLSIDTPKFMIESDATIVAPLIFGYLLGL